MSGERVRAGGSHPDLRTCIEARRGQPRLARVVVPTETKPNLSPQREGRGRMGLSLSLQGAPGIFEPA